MKKNDTPQTLIAANKRSNQLNSRHSDARAELLFCSVNLLFFDVPVVVVVS